MFFFLIYICKIAFSDKINSFYSKPFKMLSESSSPLRTLKTFGLSIPETSFMILPAFYEASKELKERGVNVTTFGLTRTTAISAFCLISGENPKKLVGDGRLQAVVGMWGLGLWINDWLDRQNILEAKSPSQELPYNLDGMFVFKNENRISLLEERDKIIGALPENIKVFAEEAFAKLSKTVGEIEKNRPSLRCLQPEKLLKYRNEVNIANSSPLVSLLTFGYSKAEVERIQNILIPYMKACCLVDDIVGFPDDLYKGLPTYVTYSARIEKELPQAYANLAEAKENVERGRVKKLPSGLQLIEQLPLTRSRIDFLFEDFLNEAPNCNLKALFDIGIRTLKGVYPVAYQWKSFQYLMGHRTLKNRQVFI